MCEGEPVKCKLSPLARSGMGASIETITLLQSYSIYGSFLFWNPGVALAMQMTSLGVLHLMNQLQP